MSLSIMRRVKFAAGHRLLNHGGKCECLHGHNYVAEFHVTGSQVDEVGRLIDFAQLKALFKGWIDAHWDHGMLLWEEDDEAIEAVRAVEPHKLYLLPANPSAENLATYLLQRICPKLLEDTLVKATRVTIWETPDACAVASIVAGEDQETVVELFEPASDGT